MKEKTAIPALIFSCLSLLSGCAASLSSTSSLNPYNQEVVQVARLVEDELPKTRPLDSLEIAQKVVSLSHRYETDPLLVMAIIKTESRFRPWAHSTDGAIGLMQIMPVLVKVQGRQIDVTHVSELRDPYKNIHMGIHYLTYLMERYDHAWDKALAAYNAGPTAVDEKIRNDRLPSRYYRKVMENYRDFREKLAAAPDLS